MSRFLVDYDVSSLCSSRISGVGVYAYNILKQMSQDEELEIRGFWRPSRWKQRDWLNQRVDFWTAPYLGCFTDTFLKEPNIQHGLDFRLLSSRKDRKTKKIVTIHDLFALKPGFTSPEFSRVFKQRLEKTLFIEKPNLIIAVSEYTRSQLLSYYPELEGRVRVVYHGADHLLENGHYNSGEREASDNFFLFVGNIEKRKNITGLLKAFDYFCEEFLNSNRYKPSLKLVGAPGYGHDEIVNVYNNMKNKNSVHWIGRVNDKELAFLYDEAMAFVYPSLAEGFGFPVLEAMSKRAPVITSRGSATEEISGENAFLVNAENMHELASALYTFYSDLDTRNKFSLMGANRVKDFLWSSCRENTKSVYKELL